MKKLFDLMEEALHNQSVLRADYLRVVGEAVRKVFNAGGERANYWTHMGDFSESPFDFSDVTFDTHANPWMAGGGAPDFEVRFSINRDNGKQVVLAALRFDDEDRDAVRFRIGPAALDDPEGLAGLLAGNFHGAIEERKRSVPGPR